MVIGVIITVLFSELLAHFFPLINIISEQRTALIMIQRAALSGAITLRADKNILLDKIFMDVWWFRHKASGNGGGKYLDRYQYLHCSSHADKSSDILIRDKKNKLRMCTVFSDSRLWPWSQLWGEAVSARVYQPEWHRLHLLVQTRIQGRPRQHLQLPGYTHTHICTHIHMQTH